MSEMQTDMLADSVGRALRDVVTARGTVAAEANGLDADAWRALRELGLAGEDAAAMNLEEQAAVLEAIGYSAALVPYADSEAMARWLAQGAGFATDAGEVLSLAVTAPDAISGQRIPWGRLSNRTVFSYAEGGRNWAGIVSTAELKLANGVNMAGEPRDKCGTARVKLAEVREVSEELSPVAVRQRGALLRCAAMLGAAARAQELTLQYAADRKQFGKPLSQFQVIQSYLAQMAGELSAASAIFATALRAAEGGASAGRLEAAAAKVRIGQAAHVITGLAHQVHGAIGFTQEYSLQLWTRRLWAWREEFGNETDWARELGSAMISLGPETYWERITQ
jgi:acyl-CoA dehydrogenase